MAHDEEPGEHDEDEFYEEENEDDRYDDYDQYCEEDETSTTWDLKEAFCSWMVSKVKSCWEEKGPRLRRRPTILERRWKRETAHKESRDPNERKKKSRCAACGQIGHWHSEAPGANFAGAVSSTPGNDDREPRV